MVKQIQLHRQRTGNRSETSKCYCRVCTQKPLAQVRLCMTVVSNNNQFDIIRLKYATCVAPAALVGWTVERECSATFIISCGGANSVKTMNLCLVSFTGCGGLWRRRHGPAVYRGNERRLLLCSADADGVLWQRRSALQFPSLCIYIITERLSWRLQLRARDTHQWQTSSTGS